MNIPNLLTLVRIVLVPVFIILLMYGFTRYAFFAFVIAGVTDALDGMIARALNQKTQLGAYLDPIADKSLLVASYFMLAFIGIIPAWLTVFVISRDILIITGIAILFLNHIKFEIKPTAFGKVSTFMQIATIFIALSPYDFLHLRSMLLEPAVYLTAGATIISGFHYTWLWVQEMNG